MGKLRGLKDRLTHKGQEATQEDARTEDDNAFLHMTSQDTGAAATHEKRENTHGKGVY